MVNIVVKSYQSVMNNHSVALSGHRALQNYVIIGSGSDFSK